MPGPGGLPDVKGRIDLDASGYVEGTRLGLAAAKALEEGNASLKRSVYDLAGSFDDMKARMKEMSDFRVGGILPVFDDSQLKNYITGVEQLRQAQVNLAEASKQQIQVQQEQARAGQRCSRRWRSSRRLLTATCTRRLSPIISSSTPSRWRQRERRRLSRS